MKSSVLRRVVAFFCFMLCFVMTASYGAESSPVTTLETETCRIAFTGAALQDGAVALDVKVCNERVWRAEPERVPAAVVVATPEEYPVTVETSLKGADVVTARARPLAAGVQVDVVDGVARMTAERPGNLVVEFNDGVDRVVHLFLGAPGDEARYAEKLAQTPEDHIVRFDAGVHDVGKLVLHDDETLYLAPGAILNGGVAAYGASNVRILGRGVVTGVKYDRWKDQLVGINLENCRNAEIEGVSILDAAAWSLQLYKSRNVAVRDIRIIGSVSNSDGISVQSCEDVKVEDSFVRSWDDSLVVKGYDADARRISFDRMTLWTDLAQSMEVGYETRAEEIAEIAFRDVCVLHNFHKPVVSIHNSDSARVHDVLFQNIVVEDAQMGSGDGVALLVDVAVLSSQWSKRELSGSVRRVRVSGLKVLEGRDDLGIRFFSEKEKGGVDMIELSGVSVCGRAIDSFDKIRTEKKNCGVAIIVKP